MVSRTNGSRLMRGRGGRGYLSNFFFSSRFGNEAWKRPLAADMSPALEENGVTIAVSMSAFAVYAVQLEPTTVHLAAVTFGQVGEMLAGSLAAGWASMSRRANDTWKHL